LGPKSDQSQIWASDAGEAAASFFVDVLGQANLIGEISPLQYGDIIEALAFSRSVRQVGNIHPNVAIWGPLEARLQSADVVVLGGLNEGVWPTEPAIDPWLSRPMRAALGMSAPEARIGLAAHDFVQNASAERVFLTRSEKVDGAPTVPSRWLLRLETVLQAFGAAHTLRSNGSYQAWSDNFEEPDTADKQAAPIMAPKPTPPVAARPRQLSVTQIETWIRDPYAIYARKILGLEQIDPIDANPGAAERGILIHQALFQFIEKFPKTMPKDATAQLLEIGRELFDQASSGPEVDAIWWPRFEAAAAWFVEYERAARATGRQPVGGEISGSVVIAAPGGPFRLTARADRIDKDAANAIEIWDYKTGGAPTDRQVQSGLTPQLSLEAAIAQAGGFDGVAAGALARLGYIKLSGGLEPGVVQAIKADPSALAGAALAGLERLIIQYDDPTTPYVSRARPMFEARTGGYDHLARAKEWASFGSEDSQ
jgi:ATP-dependent helicase/nuclease subunit B